MSITITEALAEIKTISKRIETKRAFIIAYLARPDAVKDPLEKDGGSVEANRREMQGIRDLCGRILTLRAGIRRANEKTLVTINGATLSISDWLTWRREVVPILKTFNASIKGQLESARREAKNRDVAIVPQGGTATARGDIIINMDESAFAKSLEDLDITLGTLDGVLSMKNATVTIDIDSKEE